MSFMYSNMVPYTADPNRAAQIRRNEGRVLGLPPATNTYQSLYAAKANMEAQAGTATAAPSKMDELIASYKQAYEQARQANEQRYGEILSGLETMGTQAAADIRDAYSNLQALNQQRMVDVGLANSTILPTLQTGATTAMNADMARLQEQLRAEKLGFMERRSDTYPDAQFYANLLQLYGQGNAPTYGKLSYGGGAGGGGGAGTSTGTSKASFSYGTGTADFNAYADLIRRRNQVAQRLGVSASTLPLDAAALARLEGQAPVAQNTGTTGGLQWAYGSGSPNADVQAVSGWDYGYGLVNPFTGELGLKDEYRTVYFNPYGWVE